MHGLCSPLPPNIGLLSTVAGLRSRPTQCLSPMLLTLLDLEQRGLYCLGSPGPCPEELDIREVTSRDCFWRGILPSPGHLLSFQMGWVTFSILLLLVRLTGPSRCGSQSLAGRLLVGHPPSLNGPGSQVLGSLHGLLQEPWHVVYHAVSMMVRLGATNEPCEVVS